MTDASQYICATQKKTDLCIPVTLVYRETGSAPQNKKGNLCVSLCLGYP